VSILCILDFYGGHQCRAKNNQQFFEVRKASASFFVEYNFNPTDGTTGKVYKYQLYELKTKEKNVYLTIPSG
jgi:hypothetical protein